MFCLQVCLCEPGTQRPEEGVRSIRTGVIRACEDGYWVSNPGPLQETQPSPVKLFLFKKELHKIADSSSEL